MPPPEPNPDNPLWPGRVRQALSRYDEALLRAVAQRLLKPRNQWPAEELIERALAFYANPVSVDRRLKELPPAARKLLALIGLSRQPRWRVGHLLALLAVLGHAEGLTPVLTLLETGLLFPELPESAPTLKQFEEWLGPSGVAQARLFAHPAVVARAVSEDLELPAPTAPEPESHNVRGADGLEWPLRLAAAWQKIAAGPVRMTQSQAFFKRDLTRLQGDELLNAPSAEHLTDVPDAALLAVALGLADGVLRQEDGEVRADGFPESWEAGLLPTLAGLWAGLFAVENWDPLGGYSPSEDGNNPFGSVSLACFLLLARLPNGEWADPAAVARWVWERHPSWSASSGDRSDSGEAWVRALFLGVGFELRLTEAIQAADGWRVRLSDVGRHLLASGPAPNLEHNYRQTLIVQPNAEVIVYRQGLTPGLIGRLSRFASWKVLGAACTLELNAESVYHGLESGFGLKDVLQALQQHGMRPVPANVLDSLQRWADKRERITVYSSATLIEFASPADLADAVSRGLVSVKVTERIGLVEGGEIDYRHFRLLGNRDYEAKPQKCVRFEPDGVTFTVDAAQSDLVLEAELARMAEAVRADGTGPRQYRLTPRSLKGAQSGGLTLADLEQWAQERSGERLSPSARLLFAGSAGNPARARRLLVVYLPNEEVANGVAQWPSTGRWVAERLGPTAVAVAEENLAAFAEQLDEVGVPMQREE